MKNINDVLRQKEQILQQLQREVEALRLAAQLLADDNDHATATPTRTAAPVATPPAPAPITQPAATPAPSGGYSAAWGNTNKQFP